VLRTCKTIYKHIYTCMYVYIDRKKPPPWGGFLSIMFPHQKPCVRGPPSMKVCHPCKTMCRCATDVRVCVGVPPTSSCHTHGVPPTSYRTKGFLESSGCQPRPLTTSGYQPRLTQWVKIPMHVSSELMVQIKEKGVHGVENPLP